MKKTLLATAALLALTGMAQAQSATPDDDVLELAIRVVPDQEAWQPHTIQGVSRCKEEM